MELSSTLNKTWNFSALLSLSGFVVIFFILNQSHQKVNIFATSIEPGQLDSDPLKVSVIKPIEPNLPKVSIVKSLELELLNDTIVGSFEPKEVAQEPSKQESETEPLKDDHIAEKAAIEQEPSSFTVIEPPKEESNIQKRCNMFEGRWVYKPGEDKPIYDPARCPFADNQVDCRNNGRRDFDYEKWKWEARDCDVPLFNGRDMLQRLRNKKLIIVGDSLNRNQWESLACLLYFSIDPSRVKIDTKGDVKYLKAMDYNCTVEFHWSPLLVDLDKKHKSGRKVLVLDKISPSSRRWGGAHVMVFNSAHWWTHPNSIKAWDVFQYKGQLIEEMPREEAYEKGLTTWLKWLENNVDPHQTKVYFRSISPTHFGQQHCYNVTQPIKDIESIVENRKEKLLVDVLKRKIEGINKVQVQYLNITNLSLYRRDSHPSVYLSSLSKSKSVADLIKMKSDCSHWCLPGLPDTWNRLLYASLVLDSSIDSN